MSRAYICDNCGRILPIDADIHGIWITNPLFIFDDGKEANVHLCTECYERFRHEFLENLTEEQGA